MTEKVYVCATPDEHAHTVALAQQDMPSGDTMQALAEQFKLFGDTTRVRILWALAQGELCVCDLVKLLGCSQSLVSHQLRLLRQARLVRFVKKGKTSVYRLDDEHVWQMLTMGLRHVQEGHEGSEDDER